MATDNKDDAVDWYSECATCGKSVLTESAHCEGGYAYHRECAPEPGLPVDLDPSAT